MSATKMRYMVEDIDHATDIFNVDFGTKTTVTKALRLGKKQKVLTNQD